MTELQQRHRDRHRCPPAPAPAGGDVPGDPPRCPTARPRTGPCPSPAAFFYDQFGVFPIEVQARPRAPRTRRPPAPSCPTGRAAPAAQAGLQVAWIWPLIDTPQQGACSQTLDRTRRLRRRRRPPVHAARRRRRLGLDGPPDLGDRPGPALRRVRDDARLLHRRQRRVHRPAPPRASTAATQWLSSCSGHGRPARLPHPVRQRGRGRAQPCRARRRPQAAYRLGDTVASQILPRRSGRTGTGTGDGAAGRLAGRRHRRRRRADQPRQRRRHQHGGAQQRRAASSTSAVDDNALARTTAAPGPACRCCSPTRGSPASSARPRGPRRRAPSSPRPGLPRADRDDRRRGAGHVALAGGRAADRLGPVAGRGHRAAVADAGAPWLRAADLGTLATAAAKLPSARRAGEAGERGRAVSDGYLDQLASVAGERHPVRGPSLPAARPRGHSLAAAVAVTESSAWRGRGSPGGWLALTELSSYITDPENTVELIPARRSCSPGPRARPRCRCRTALTEPVQVQVMATTPPGSELAGGLVPTRCSGEAGYDPDRQDAGALHHHRDHHIAATVADKGRVAAEPGRHSR